MRRNTKKRKVDHHKNDRKYGEKMKIEEFRKENNLTQKALAEILTEHGYKCTCLLYTSRCV